MYVVMKKSMSEILITCGQFLRNSRLTTIHKFSFAQTAFLLAVIIGINSGCAKITIRPNSAIPAQDAVMQGGPDYERSMPYFFFGIVGVRHVDVKKICNNRPVLQMQSVHTPEDVIKTVFTLGIYTPKTAQVWCATTAG